VDREAGIEQEIHTTTQEPMSSDVTENMSSPTASTASPTLSAPSSKGGTTDADLPDLEFDLPPRAVLGCVLIPTDRVIDMEFPQLLAHIPGVVYTSQKMEWDTSEITADTYQRLYRSISKAASVYRPLQDYNVMALACTSMAFTLGAELVDSELREAAPEAKGTDMARAQVAAIRALGGWNARVALLTPYVEDLSRRNQAFLEEAGLKVVARRTMGLLLDTEITRVKQSSLLKLAKEMMTTTECDVFCFGCGGLRTFSDGFIDRTERELGVPVVTSNQAMVWRMLRLADIQDNIQGFGTLLSKR